MCDVKMSIPTNINLFSLLENGLTEMTIALYKSVAANLLPTPAKMHYLFNLRDISKVHNTPFIIRLLYCLAQQSQKCLKNIIKTS